MTFRFIVSFLLEPIGYLLFVGSLILYTTKIKSEFRYKVIAISLLLIFVVLVFMLVEDSDQNTQWYSFIYLVTGIGWGLYFWSLLIHQSLKAIGIITIVVIICYFFIVNILLTPPVVFDSLGFVIGSTAIILMIFIYFYQLLASVKEEPLSLNFDFWICCSQFIYHLGAFGIFLTYNHFTTRYISAPYNNSENQELLTYLWGVHNVLLFLASLLTWVGVLWIVYRRKLPSS